MTANPLPGVPFQPSRAHRDTTGHDEGGPAWGTPDTTTPDITPDGTSDTTPDAPADTGRDGSGDTEADAGAESVVLEGVVLPGTAVGAAVDAVVSAAPVVRSARDVEVIPGWLRDRSTATAVARDAAARAGRVVAFHAVRVPTVYFARLAARSPRGLARVTRWVFDWATDAKGRAVRRGIAYGTSLGGMEATAYHRVTEQHRERVRLRLTVLTVLAVLATVAGWAGLATGPAWLPVLAVAGVVVVFGAAGRTGDARPVLSRSVVESTVPRFTSELILTALGALGVAELNRGLKDPAGVRFVGPIHRDGPGWRADLDLPGGATAGDVMDRRDRLASGLRRPTGCVWPGGVEGEHPGRLTLWVGDRPMNKARPDPWPLAQRGTVSLFDPFPFGVDQRGRPVPITLMFASMVIGSVPRMGKTFALRLLALAAALDPTAELHLYDLKGIGDLGPLEPVCHRYRVGARDEDIAYAVASMRELSAQIETRNTVLRTLPRNICPESKITPELAGRKDLGVHPVFLGIDECQRWFEHPTYGGELEAIVTDLVKRGPAAGIIVVPATQRPDAKSLPTGISANAVLRFALKVMGHTENDMILGSGAYRVGVRATMFARSDKGIGYLSGEGEDPIIVRTAYVDAPGADRIVARARAARERAGRITGYAAGLDPTGDDTGAPTVLTDVLAVAGTDTKVWSETLLARLVDYRPDTYTGWEPADLGAALNAYGVPTVQIGRRDPTARKVVNRRGVDIPTIRATLTERDQRKSA